MRDEEPMSIPVPVTIIAGFLGAGKTTLLNRLLTNADGVRYGVLINDFAAINVDAALIRESGPQRIALTNGCVCCTMRDDLMVSALELINSEPRPEHIIIECSGVSDPRSVAAALTGELAAGAFKIDTVLSLIDTANVLDLDFDDTECVIDQAAVSDLVLLNKCDIAATENVNEIEQMLRAAQPSMRLIRTTHASLPSALLSGGASSVMRQDGPAESTVGHAVSFASRAWSTWDRLKLAEFETAVHALSPSVYRAKGILHFAEHPSLRAVFHLVGRRSELSFEPAVVGDHSSSLVAIGRREAFDASAFELLFRARNRITVSANARQSTQAKQPTVSEGDHP
jgi:G3E family GTPase